jgi:hypothetical protein
MKAHYRKRIRMLRRLAIAGCLAGLAVPTGASAMLPNDSGNAPANQDNGQKYTLPAGFHTEAQTWRQQTEKQQPYGLPSRFRTEIQNNVQKPAQPVEQPFTLRRDFRPEVQATASPASTTPSPSVIRQIETVTNDSGRTLSIVLAAIALAVALGSLAYATLRMAQIQRRSLGSGSH